METTLYLVRHGEALGGEDDDPPLSELGRAQARAVGTRLAGLPFDEVLHGSRRRARETAEEIARGLDLRAVYTSHADDRTPEPADQSALTPALREFLAAVPADERDPAGAALDAAMEELGRLGEVDRHVLAVTHNFVIGWVVRAALHAPTIEWTRLNSSNGALTIVQFRSGQSPRLVAFNDTGHLPD